MSAHLYFSNSPALLLDRLSQNLDFGDPFRAPHIATPTPAMKRWVQMRLADKRGIVANVRFMHLERTLWKRLEELDQEHVVAFRKPARLLDEQGLQLLILGLLRQAPPPEVVEYLREDAAAGRADFSEALRARRLCQLSLKLAGFFREYEYSRVQEHGRQGLAYLWKQGEDCFSEYLDGNAPKAVRTQVEKLERWQKAVYHALFKPGGLRDALGEKLGQYSYTLPQYTEMVLGQKRPPLDSAGPAAPSPASYHLFGLSQISPFHRSLIRRLSDGAALRGREARFHIYSLNPCAEYWEDLLTPRERRKLMQEDLFRRQKYLGWRALDPGEKQRLRLEIEDIQAEELHLDEEENPLLSQWGKPGRENIQLWSQDHAYDFHSRFEETQGGNLLATVREAVLKRRGRLPAEDRVAQDASLRIFACPEIHREIETVQQSIVEDLLRDAALRPEDIAVLAPDLDKYRHVIAAVFDRLAPGSPGHVPHALAETSAAAESEYARAVRSLFELARGRFSRREIFALAANPCFRHGLGLDEDALRAWARWAEGLNIYHGFDGEARSRRGYPRESAHTWAQGLDRLVLGTVMESPRPEDFRHFAGIVPFADGYSPDRELLESFLLVIEGLHRGLAPLRAGPDAHGRSWAAWLALLTRLFDTYLTIADDAPLEGFVRTELRRYLLELQNMDGLEALMKEDRAAGSLAGRAQPLLVSGSALPSDAGSATSASHVDVGVPAEILMDLILDRLDGLKAGREGAFTGGVQIASLHALRSLPFRIVYIVGLGEGEFPEDAATSTLDLRQYRRVIGDVDPSARNRYLFLEALVCARDKLCLSYVSRDVQQGKTFQMSSVLNELVDYLESGVLAPEAGKPARFRNVQVPLLSRSPALFAAPSGEPWNPPRNFSREERLLSWLEEQKRRYLEVTPGARAFPRALRAALPEELRREVFPEPEAGAAGNDLPSSTSQGDALVEKIHLEDLRRYLENPVQSTLRRHLGIRDFRDDDLSAARLEDEPFFCPPPWDRALLERAFRDRVVQWETASRASGRESFEALYASLSRRGLTPEGHYQVLDREALWAKAESGLEAMEGVFARLREGGAPECLLNVSLGEGDKHAAGEPVSAFPPLRLPLSDGRVAEIHGQLPCLFRMPDGGCATLIAVAHDLPKRRLLSPFLFYVAGLLSDSPLGAWLRGGKFTIHYVSQESYRFSAGNWAPFDIAPESARLYLGNLAESMSAGPDFDLLPFNLIDECLTDGNRLAAGLDYAETLRSELEQQDEKEYRAYYPGETAKLLDPRVPHDAGAKVRARFHLFYNWKADGVEGD